MSKLPNGQDAPRKIIAFFESAGCEVVDHTTGCSKPHIIVQKDLRTARINIETHRGAHSISWRLARDVCRQFGINAQEVYDNMCSPRRAKAKCGQTPAALPA